MNLKKLKTGFGIFLSQTVDWPHFCPSSPRTGLTAGYVGKSGVNQPLDLEKFRNQFWVSYGSNIDSWNSQISKSKQILRPTTLMFITLKNRRTRKSNTLLKIHDPIQQSFPWRYHDEIISLLPFTFFLYLTIDTLLICRIKHEGHI